MARKAKDDHQDHLDLQKSYFEEHADFFAQPIPESIQERTRRIVRLADLSKSARVLDVACGMGAMIKHFLELPIAAENIVGCDLCPAMLAQAIKRFPQVTFWQGDITEFPADSGRFDFILLNACFGNFFNQEDVLGHCHKLINEHGSIVISHPLGARFVASLHNSEPDLVPHLLPTKEALLESAQLLSMQLTEFIDEPDFYLAKLSKESR